MQFSNGQFLGAITREPTFRTVKGGLPVLEFVIAGVQSHQGHDITWYQLCQFVGAQAINWSTKLVAGQVVYATGMVITHASVSELGNKKVSTFLKVHNLGVLTEFTPILWKNGYILIEGAMNEVTALGVVTFNSSNSNTNGIVQNLGLGVRQFERSDYLQVTAWNMDPCPTRSTIIVKGFLYTDKHEKGGETIYYGKIQATSIIKVNANPSAQSKPSAVVVKEAAPTAPVQEELPSEVFEMDISEDDDDDFSYLP